MPSITGDGSTALEVIYDALLGASLVTPGAVFLGREADGYIDSNGATVIPDEAVFLTEGDGIPDLTMGLPIAIEHPTIQIMVRGAQGEYLNPKRKAKLIRFFVASLRDETSRGVTLNAAIPLGSILPLGQDEAGRHRFTVNFNTSTQENTYVP